MLAILSYVGIQASLDAEKRGSRTVPRTPSCLARICECPKILAVPAYLGLFATLKLGSSPWIVS